MSHRQVKSRVANSDYSVSGAGHEIGYTRWEVRPASGTKTWADRSATWADLLKVESPEEEDSNA
jgi:hypothetical protein